MESLPLGILLLIFAGAAAVIWVAGIQLSKQTDVLDVRLHLGSALGGLILLAIATNLPEVAITISAALSGNLEVAVGNILGGIALQTVVLVILDLFSGKGKRPLTYRAASLTLVIEAVTVIGVLGIVVAGSQMPSDLVAFRITPAVALIALAWIGGLLLVQRAQKGLPWHEEGQAPDGQHKPKGHSKQHAARTTTTNAAGTTAVAAHHAGQGTAQKAAQEVGRKAGTGTGSGAQISTRRSLTFFILAAAATLVSGVVLERSGDAIASEIGLSGILFGATILALATSLPEISTGLASVRKHDDQLAVSDIFGGNAFLPVLFLLATLISGQSVLPQAQNTDIYLTALAILLTLIYILGLLFRPSRRIFGMGIDSLAVLTLYLLGVAGLFVIAGQSS